MLLTGEDLAVERDGKVIFKGVSFAARAGELVLLQGRNGSGKTSLLKLIAGLLRPMAGALALSGAKPDLTIGQQAHLIGHGQALRPALTVSENLEFWTGFLGGGEAIVGLEAFGLLDLADLPAGVLSAGQQRRLCLARLVAVAKPIWLLDEPSVGLDQASLRQLGDHMRDHLRSGGIIFAATHGELEVKAMDRIELGVVR